ncbi:M-phase phosphoprotein 6 isoform X1 [Panthera tigris]|nr:M-phase phosphoprotein 6 isoform X1 [Panthera tigris]XP_007082893.2 M-phase phosphoprotein 6 isoform X1 [Panthera tigris]
MMRKLLSRGSGILAVLLTFQSYLNCPVETTLVKERPDKGQNCSRKDQTRSSDDLVAMAAGMERIITVEFMQRGLDSETKRQLEEEEKKIISEEHWYLDLPELKEKECFIIEEQSFLLCEDLLYGRMSFRGFNPEVEKLMLQMNSKNKTEEVESETVELDVSDEEMARRYETLVGTIGKKFAKKRDRVNYEEDENGHVKPTVKVKKMFLKPQD